MYVYLGPSSGSNDYQSMLETAATLNLLGATWIGLLNYKKYLWPAYPAFWGDYHNRLSEVMMIDYYWAGYAGIICYPGSDPWYGNYNIAHALTVYIFGINVPLAVTGGAPYYYSALWKWQTSWTQWTMHDTGTGYNNDDCLPHNGAPCGWAFCNFSTNHCGCTQGGYDATITAACLANARTEAIPQFESNDEVSLIHKSMGALLWAGGGNYPADFTNTSWPQFPTTAFLDPVVVDSNYCATTSHKAYPMNGYYGY